MIRRIWRVIKKFWRRMFAKRPTIEFVTEKKASKRPISSPIKVFAEEKAEALYIRGCEQFLAYNLESAIASCDEALKIKPDYHQALTLKGFMLCDLGRYEEAIASVKKAKSCGVPLVKSYTEGVTEHLYKRSWQQYQAGDFEGAIASCDDALELQPDVYYYHIWSLKGVVLSDLERYEEAITSFKTAKLYNAKPVKEFTEREAEVLHKRGWQQYQAGNFEGAITSLDQALEIKSDHHLSWELRGAALFNIERNEEAIASLDQALHLKPDSSRVWGLRGVAFLKTDRYEEAINSCDQALRFNSDDLSALFVRGSALCRLGRYEEAIASLDQTVKLEPHNYLAWQDRGVALYRLGKYEEAIASLDQCVKFKPDTHDAWLNRGLAAGKSVTCDRSLSFSSFVATRNPQLNLRGYDGQLVSYEEGLKYCSQSEGQGLLHHQIGKAHYFHGLNQYQIGEDHCLQGLYEYQPLTYYHKAVTSYNEALKFLTIEDFPQLRLDVLRDLIPVYLHLSKTTEAQELKRMGTDLLRRLLDKYQIPEEKKQLTLEFLDFQQFTVDLAVQSGNLSAALELAENGKNACLGWLLSNGFEDFNSQLIPQNQLTLTEIQQLLNPTTAIVYWHLSPYALHTFILTNNTQPVILQPLSQRLHNFETWKENWNQEYNNYRESKDIQVGEKHIWRNNLTKKLEELKEILDINTIENIISSFPSLQEGTMGSNSIENLILIPHRDLHRFPLHALFSDKFTITYLPSAQIGINLKKFNPNPTPINQLPILSIENPENEYPMLPQTEIESAAINQLFPISQQLAQNQATKQEVINALQNNYGILHFTGHGFYNFNNPQKSALALSGKDLLTLEEIYNIPNLNKYQLVTLSACETAITNQQTITAEYVGLVSAFLAQGVNTVISTLWTVPDISSGFFMIYFYWQLKKGKPPALALKKSQKWLSNLTFTKLERIYNLIFPKLPREEVPLRPFIRSYINTAIPSMSIAQKQQKLYANPYYWAGFTITGC